MPSEPPDLAIVVRGGLLNDLDAMRDSAIDDRDALGFYGLSVFAKTRDPGQSVDDVVWELARRGHIRNPRLRVTTAGRLRARGFALVQTGNNRLHYSVVLADLDLAVIARFEGAFGPPKERPT